MTKTGFSIVLLLITLFAVAQKAERSINSIQIGKVNCLAISFDGNKAVTGGDDSRAYFWDVAKGNKLRAFAAQAEAITDAKFNNDESLFATSSKNKTIVVWDRETMKPKKVLAGSTTAVLGVAFNPFNNELLSISADGQVKLWDAIGGKLIRDVVKVGSGDLAFASVSFSVDGKVLGVGTPTQFALYKTDGTLVKTFAVSGVKTKQYFDFSPDGKTVAFKSANVQLTIANTTGEIITTLNGQFQQNTTVRFAQKSDALMLGNEKGSIEFYNINDKKVTSSFSAHAGGVVDALLSLDGSKLITIGNDLTLKRWDVTEQKTGWLASTGTDVKNLEVTKKNFIDENNNGLLDGGEKAALEIIVQNKSTMPCYKAVLILNQVQTLKGLDIPPAVMVGNILPNSSKTFKITLSPEVGLAAGSSLINLQLASAGDKADAGSITLQAGSSANAGVAVKSFQFFSPSGKAAKGEPITLMVSLENITRIVAEKVEVRYVLPAGVTAIDKVKEVVSSIASNSIAQVSMQFIIDKKFVGDTVAIGLELSGVGYTNSNQAKVMVPVGQTIGLPDQMVAAIDNNKSGQTRSMLPSVPTPDAASDLEKGRYVALIIGIGGYSGSWNKLDNAVNDARAIEQMLSKQYGFSVIRTVYDKMATRQNIINELEWLVANLKESDNLVIYYSGHGDFKTAMNKGYWVPVDAATNSTSYLISNSDLQTFLSSIPTKHTLLISDACFSGDIFRSGSASAADKNMNEKYYNRINSLKSRQAITSGGIEPVMDGGKDGHSVFTYYFLKSLKENTSKFLDASQLFENVKIPVVNNSNQAPQFSHLKNTGDEGGEFIFMKK